jgi:hypothetical protein
MPIYFMINHNKYGGMKRAFLGLIGAGALAVSSGCSTAHLEYALGAAGGIAAGSPNAPYTLKQRQSLALTSDLTRNDAQWRHDRNVANGSSSSNGSKYSGPVYELDVKDPESLCQYRKDLTKTFKAKGMGDKEIENKVDFIIAETIKGHQ